MYKGMSLQCSVLLTRQYYINSAMILHQVLCYYKPGWIIYFLLFAYFQQFFPNALCLAYRDYFSIKWNFLIVDSYCIFPIQLLLIVDSYCIFANPIIFDMYFKWRPICDIVTNPVSSFQSCHGNWFNIFIACLYKCWLSKSVLGISHWTVCIEWRVFSVTDIVCIYL